MRPVGVVALAALMALGCSDAGTAEPGSGGGAGGSAGSNGAGSSGSANAGGTVSGSQGGSSSASVGQVHLLVDDIQDYGDATGTLLAGLDAEEFCGDRTDPSSLKPEGTVMRSPGTGRYFVCLSTLSSSSSTTLLDTDPGAPLAGHQLSAALFHFEDAAHPNPNPGAAGPTNFGLVMLELNEFSGRSQCMSSNAVLTGFKDVGRQKLLAGESICFTGAATYIEDDKRWVKVQLGGTPLNFELEAVAVGN